MRGFVGRGERRWCGLRGGGGGRGRSWEELLVCAIEVIRGGIGTDTSCQHIFRTTFARTAVLQSHKVLRAPMFGVYFWVRLD